MTRIALLALTWTMLPAVAIAEQARGAAGEFLARGEWSRAMQAANDPTDPWAVLSLTEAHHFLKEAGPDAPAWRELVAAHHLHLRRDLAAADASWRDVLAAAERTGTADLAYLARARLAVVLQDRGLLDEALDLHERTIRDARGRGDPIVAVEATYGLAYALVGRGDFPAGRERAEEAAREAALLDLPVFAGHAEALLATLAHIDADLKATRRHLDRAVTAYESSGRARNLASALRRAAATDASFGEYARAIGRLDRARDLALGIGDTREASYCLEHLGSMNHAIGRLELARAQWSAALKEAGDTWPDAWTANALMNLGDVAGKLGRENEARVMLERAVEVSRRDPFRLGLPWTLLRTAGHLRRGGRLDEALAHAAEARGRARELELPLGEAAANCELGRIALAADDPEGAAESFRGAEQVAAGRGFWEIDVQVASGLSRALELQGDRDAAREQLETAIAWAERLRHRTREMTVEQQRLFETHAPMYARMVGLLPADTPAVSYEYAQRAKARSLLDLLAEGDVRLRVRADPAYRERERDLLRRLADVDPGDVLGLAQLESELSLLEQELRREDPRYADLRYPRPASLDEVRASLPTGTVLLEYLVGNESSWVWIVTRGAARVAAIPDHGRIAEQVQQLRTLLADYNVLGAQAAYFVSAARALGESILDPAAPELASARVVLVAPDGPLHLVPFEALLLDNSESDSYRELPYAVTRFDIARIASGTASVLATDRRSGRTAASGGRDSSRGALLMGDPRIVATSEASLLFEAAAGSSPPPLPYVRSEIDAIAARLPASSRLTDDRATRVGLEAAFAADAPPSVLHLATHGVFNQRRPRLSGLLLTATDADDGFLSLGEVFALELPCELVVLSACATSLGETVAGEGVLGLTRAFRFAGARDVVSSLWSVSGAATAAFMERFYAERAEAERGADAAHALSEAKRRWIREVDSVDGLAGADAAHPCFWAAFVLTR